MPIPNIQLDNVLGGCFVFIVRLNGFYTSASIISTLSAYVFGKKLAQKKIIFEQTNWRMVFVEQKKNCFGEVISNVISIGVENACVNIDSEIFECLFSEAIATSHSCGFSV